MTANITLLRIEYDEWRRREHIRHSEARWEAFVAGSNASRPPEIDAIDSLPEAGRLLVLSVLQAAIEQARKL